jgi:hypothetical protein
VSLFATIITHGCRNGANDSPFGGNGERGDLAGPPNGGGSNGNGGNGANANGGSGGVGVDGRNVK